MSRAAVLDSACIVVSIMCDFTLSLCGVLEFATASADTTGCTSMTKRFEYRALAPKPLVRSLYSESWKLPAAVPYKERQ